MRSQTSGSLLSLVTPQKESTAFAPPRLKTVFSGEHAWCGEKMMLSGALAGAVPLTEFFASDGFSAALSTYAAAHGGSDRRAIASMWSLYYFSALAIPYIVARRLGEQALPVAFDRMTLALAEDGLPRAFGIEDAGVWSENTDGDVLSLLSPLIKTHLAETVRHLKAHGGISERLSWNNAAVYIDYALTATERENVPGTDGWVGRPLFERITLPDGSVNPFLGCLSHEKEEGGIVCRRKVCCLRYLLPGIPSCGDLCALPSQRKQ